MAPTRPARAVDPNYTAGPSRASRGGDIVTTQQTSKIYKAIQLIGVLMICASPVACVGGHADGSAELIGFGLLLWLGARLGAWWANG